MWSQQLWDRWLFYRLRRDCFALAFLVLMSRYFENEE